MIYSLEGHQRSGYGVGFSLDDRYLISGSCEQTFRLWNLDTGRCTLTFHGSEKNICNIIFTGNEELLVTSSQGDIYFYKF